MGRLQSSVTFESTPWGKCTLWYIINDCFQMPRFRVQLENTVSSSLLVHFSFLLQESLAGRVWWSLARSQKRNVPWVWLRVRNGTASTGMILTLCVSVSIDIQTDESWSWFCKNGAYAPKTFRQIFKPYLETEVNLSQSLTDCRYLAAFWPWTLLKAVDHT